MYLFWNKDGNFIFGVLVWHPDNRSHCVELFWQINKVFIHLLSWPFNRIKNKLTAMLHTYISKQSQKWSTCMLPKYIALYFNKSSILKHWTYLKTTFNSRQTTTLRILPTITLWHVPKQQKQVFQLPNQSNPAIYSQITKANFSSHTHACIHDSLPQNYLLLRTHLKLNGKIKPLSQLFDYHISWQQHFTWFNSTPQKLRN